MKKLLLLMAGGCIVTGAMAQNSSVPTAAPKPYYRNADPSKNSDRVQVMKVTGQHPFNFKAQAKTTNVSTIVTEDFSSGSGSSLPTGWSVSSPVGSNWTWRNTAPQNYYAVDNIASPTAANGYMIFRSDSIGDALPAIVPEGSLTSPSYDCSGKTGVGVQFYEQFYSFQDSCFLEVSVNGGAWSSYPIFPNNLMSPNENVDPNGYKVVVNIAAQADNQSDVKIRFHYMGFQTGSYSWSIDDVSLVELDPVEVGVNHTSILMTTEGNGMTSFGIIPKNMVDSLWPVSLVNNLGGTAPANADVSNKIYRNGSQVYTQPYNYASLAVNTFWDIADITDQPGYVPTQTGNYSAVSRINISGDADASNDQDTLNFIVSDTTWSQEAEVFQWIFTAHSATTSKFMGSRIDIPASKVDTLTSASIAFYTGTSQGTKASIQIYAFANGAWGLIGSSVERTLTAADISGNVKFTAFPMDMSSGPVILDGSLATTYAAVLQTNNVNATPAHPTVKIWGTDAPGFQLVGASGLEYDSQNDGAADFAATGLPTSLGSAAPVIRFNFGSPWTLPTGASTVNIKTLGDAYPNPSNTAITIPFSVQNDANVTVSITNAIGQSVMSENVGKVAANQPMTVKFNTSRLNSGVYFYTVEANGQRLTKRFAVAH